ncbi:DNA-binding protein [Hydrogenophaga sp. A37]|uniref:hypothetical protein n=1 Tax=Hydrogenophaga sp. A37 TaxID=1945864 RepID=UPI00098419FF|nr:hypothetical protein [Hydrogenophaga sp. A37]
MPNTQTIAVGIGPLGYAIRPLRAPSLPKTTAEVKAQFHAEGKAIGDWADQHGFRRSDVYRVLNGFSAMKRGLPHQIAIALGLKPGAIQ